ncbi:MAG: class I SAM-dependent methyltransferase [Bacteriovoracia bacterium]
MQAYYLDQENYFRATTLPPLKHSAQVDAELGFSINDIENRLHRAAFELDPEGHVGTWGKKMHAAQTWVGLAPQTLLTPYDELSRMCDLLHLPEGAHVADLGAAYGRMGFVLHKRFPGAHFTGIEIVEERVNEGNRLFALHGCKNARLIQHDMFAKDFQLPLADCYLIYDYGAIDHLRWTMGQLQNLATVHRFQVIARGETIRSLIQYAHPWLADVAVVKHEKNFSVYANYVS